MIYSKQKLEDIKWRKQVLELMQKFLKEGKVEEAKELGRISQTIKQRIETNTYAL